MQTQTEESANTVALLDFDDTTWIQETVSGKFVLNLKLINSLIDVGIDTIYLFTHMEMNNVDLAERMNVVTALKKMGFKVPAVVTPLDCCGDENSNDRPGCVFQACSEAAIKENLIEVGANGLLEPKTKNAQEPESIQNDRNRRGAKESAIKNNPPKPKHIKGPLLEWFIKKNPKLRNILLADDAAIVIEAVHDVIQKPENLNNPNFPSITTLHVVRKKASAEDRRVHLLKELTSYIKGLDEDVQVKFAPLLQDIQAKINNKDSIGFALINDFCTKNELSKYINALRDIYTTLGTPYQDVSKYEEMINTIEIFKTLSQLEERYGTRIRKEYPNFLLPTVDYSTNTLGSLSLPDDQDTILTSKYKAVIALKRALQDNSLDKNSSEFTKVLDNFNNTMCKHQDYFETPLVNKVINFFKELVGWEPKGQVASINIKAQLQAMREAQKVVQSVESPTEEVGISPIKP